MISVVVPVYNLKSFIPRCMDSLLCQTFRDFELIIVDDGSTDGSDVVCDCYSAANADIIQCIHKPNGGLSSARNAGIDAAKGEFVIFPDPDDWVEKNYLEYLHSLQIRFQTDMVCTGHFVDCGDKSVPANQAQPQVLMSGEEARLGLLLSPCMSGFAWNKLYRLDIIRENKLRFLDDVGITEDLDFTYRYLQFCNSVCFDPSVRTYHYCQRSGAATRSGFSQKKLQSIHTYEKILISAGESSVLGCAAKEEICNTAVNLLPMYLSSGDQNAEIYQTIRRYIRQYYSDYLKSRRYGITRKIQAVIARYAPKLYGIIKTGLRGREKK